MKLNKLWKEDAITVYVCLIILAVGYYALQSDFSFFNSYQTKDNNSSFNLGTISKVKSDVRRRTVKNIFWSNAQINDVVTQGDSLFVGPDSAIVINFPDGKSITIGPNSLLKFKTENQKIKLNLQYGSIKSENLPEHLILDDCGKSLSIHSSTNTALEIDKMSECGKIQVKNKNGDVKINGLAIAQGDNSTVIDSSALMQLTDKPLVNEFILKLENSSPDEISKMETEINSLLPPQLVKEKSKVVLNSKHPALAKWLKVENADEYILETADNPEFTNAKVTRTSANVQQIDPTSDTIFYRLKSVNSSTNSDYSKTGTIKVIYPSIKPTQKTITYDYFSKNPGDIPKTKKFSLSWNKIPNADKYVVQVDTDPNFKKPKEYITRTPASQIQVPGQGNYHYRIAAYNANDRKISSTNSLGEIIYNRVFNLKTPAIEKSYARLTYFFQKGLGKFIWLKWSSEATTTDKFRVEIAKDQNFTNVFKSYYTQKNKVLIQDRLPEGQYYWRVRSESTDTEKMQISDWSELGHIEIHSGKH